MQKSLPLVLMKYFLCLFLLCAGGGLWSQEERPRRFRLPAVISEASGLVYAGPDSLWWHNDSGDRPNLYLTDDQGNLLRQVTIPGIEAIDWEDLTTDRQGTLFVGDFGNNRGQRPFFKIYQYQAATEQVDSITFSYPGQNGKGRAVSGNYDTEGFFYHNDSLHLFTKDLLDKGPFTTYHFAIPAQAGTYTAEFRDSLTLKKRVITGATIDPNTGSVYFITYFFRMGMGFIPRSSTSVYVLQDYPDGHYLRGQLGRKGIACLIPRQYEAIDVGPDGYLFVGTEQTKANKPKAKPVRISKLEKKRIRN